MKIKEYLVKRNIRQIALAKEAEVDPSALNKAINGWIKLPEHHLKKVCEFLGITLSEFKNNKISESRQTDGGGN